MPVNLYYYVYICQRRAYSQQKLLIDDTPYNFVITGVEPKLSVKYILKQHHFENVGKMCPILLMGNLLNHRFLLKGRDYQRFVLAIEAEWGFKYN